MAARTGATTSASATCRRRAVAIDRTPDEPPRLILVDRFTNRTPALDDPPAPPRTTSTGRGVGRPRARERLNATARAGWFTGLSGSASRPWPPGRAQAARARRRTSCLTATSAPRPQPRPRLHRRRPVEHSAASRGVECSSTPGCGSLVFISPVRASAAWSPSCSARTSFRGVRRRPLENAAAATPMSSTPARSRRDPTSPASPSPYEPPETRRPAAHRHLDPNGF